MRVPGVATSVRHAHAFSISEDLPLGLCPMKRINHLLYYTYRMSPGQREIADDLAENRSLHNHPAELLSLAYRRARLDATDEMGLGLEKFPEVCPWTIDQILNEDFLPQADPGGR